MKKPETERLVTGGSPQRFKTSRQAMAFLMEFTDYENMSTFLYTKTTFDLKRMRRLLSFFNDPQRALRVVHIAGTKGKGSTAAMICAVLRAAGLKVGLFTSPHLIRMEERIRVNEDEIRSSDIRDCINKMLPYLLEIRARNPALAPTFFEILTAIALLYFKEKSVDVAILEVGMGGRLDSTNVTPVEVSCITSISFDHTDKLGDTLRQIAREKAGIIKLGVPVVCAPQAPEAMAVISKRCAARHAQLIRVGRDIHVEQSTTVRPDENRCARNHTALGMSCSIRTPRAAYDELFVPMLGRHQLDNAAVAVGALETLARKGVWEMNGETLRKGFANVKWPGRMEILSRRPWVVLDGAQNAASAQALAKTIHESFSFKRCILILAAASDKDLLGMAKEVAFLADEVVLTKAHKHRGADTRLLAQIVKRVAGKKSHRIGSPSKALKAALDMATKEDLILVTGSLYLVGAIKKMWPKVSMS